MKFEVDTKGMSRVLKLVENIEKGREKALYRNVKAVQKKMKTMISAEIRKDPQHGLNLSKKYLDSKLRTGSISYSKLQARVYASRRGTLLSRFGATQRAKTTFVKKYGEKRKVNNGIAVKVLAKGRKKRMKGAFFIRLKNSGVQGVAIRKGGKLKVLYGPSPDQAMAQVIKHSDIRERVSAFAAEDLRHQVTHLLRK